MLGISFGEVVIITLIGLIVIGPKRLPETARFLGHLFGRIQRQVRTVKNDIRREMDLEDVKNIHREYKQASKEVTDIFNQTAAGTVAAVKSVHSETEKVLGDAAAEIAAEGNTDKTAVTENIGDTAAEKINTPEKRDD